MSFIGNTIGKLVGGITGASQQADAAQAAAGTQSAAAQAGIDEQRRQFDALQKMLSPFVSAGTGALSAQQDILGLNGTGAQQSAYSNIQSSPAFQALSKSGTDAITANASATGGLRGGNVQGALAQFQPQLLAQLIQQQYGNLGAITGIGQSSAAGVGNAGVSTGNNIAQLLQQQGAATAGGQISAGNLVANSASGLGGLLGSFTGIGGLSGIKKLF